jgi:hypothetical protein
MAGSGDSMHVCNEAGRRHRLSRGSPEVLTGTSVAQDCLDLMITKASMLDAFSPASRRSQLGNGPCWPQAILFVAMNLDQTLQRRAGLSLALLSSFLTPTLHYLNPPLFPHAGC